VSASLRAAWRASPELRRNIQAVLDTGAWAWSCRMVNDRAAAEAV